jgi:putative molybdopterin biosynthesis protein
VAGIHLLDPATGEYNRPYCEAADLHLLRGYRRRQGVIHRPDDPRFAGATGAAAVAGRALEDPDCILMNRNRGSGTRVLIDQLLEHREPRGFAAEARSHNAVAAAVASGRADWSVAIETVATDAGLAFWPLADECFDLAVPRSRLERPGVQALRALLQSDRAWTRLEALGMQRPTASEVT